MKPIEKPYFGPQLYNGVERRIKFDDFNEWFDQNIEPLNELIRNGRRVVGYENKITGWIWKYSGLGDGNTEETAFLINRQPIEQDSAEKVLRDIVEKSKDVWSTDISEEVKRAKKLLAKGEE